MVANSGILSSLSTGVSTQLVDKTDSPHSGLFKALHSMTQGNYALKDGATLGFAHTFTTSGANIQVALTAGKGFSNGQYIAVDALSATTINKPSSGALYHWVAFADDGDGTGTISIVTGTSDGVVPDLTVTLTPISLIKVQSTDTHSTVAFQTFTTSKTENQLSVGFTNSNAYTEAMSIEASATRTLFKNKIADADIRFVLADNTAAEKFEIYSDDDSDGDEGDTPVFSVDGLGATSVVGTLNLGSVVNAGTDTDKFLVLDGSGNVDFRTGSEVSSDIGASGAALANDGNNRVTTATGAGGINGEANLSFDGSTLAVTGQITGTTTGTTDAGLTLINTDAGSGTAPDLVFYRNSASPADGDFTLRIDARGKNDAGSPEDINYTSIFARILDKTDGTEDGTLLIGSIVDGDTVDAFNTQLMIEGSGIRVRGLTGTGTAPAGQISIETRDTTIVADDQLGRINFSAPVESSGSDAIAVAASIVAEAKDTFSSTVNTTDLVLSTASDGAATEKLRIKSDGKIGIGTDSPANSLQVNITGADAFDGIQIVREDGSTADGDILGGIGFDSTDGNVPSSITEASAFIAAYATEDHALTDKGGELKMGISFINDDDDTTSIVLSRIGYPTSTNASVSAGAFSRAAVASVAGVTYSPAIADSGTVIIMTNSSSIVTLPDVSATEIGVQFTVINNSGGTLTGKIVSADTTNTRFNGAGSYAAQNIEDDSAKTFLCVAGDNWQVIG